MSVYLDTSALAKLVLIEAESEALARWVQDHTASGENFVASELVRTELTRAVRRVPAADPLRAKAVIDSLTLLHVTTEVLAQASRLEPESLRSLDAIHLATALILGDDLTAFVCYDTRLGEAARSYGLAVETPG